MQAACTHLKQIRFTETDVDVCRDCIMIGDSWVHLRMCLVCGHVGCCNESKNRHATGHFRRGAAPEMVDPRPVTAGILSPG